MFDFIFLGGYIPYSACIVENTDECEAWGVGLDEQEQIDIDAIVGILEEKGPHLPFPYSSDVKGAKYNALRELRVQHKGKPYRTFMPLIPAEQPSCLSAAERPVVRIGINNI